MEIESNFERIGNNYYFRANLSGNSKAIAFPSYAKDGICHVSSITGGDVSMQYSFFGGEEIKSDEAVWHQSSAGEFDENKGIPIDIKVRYIRIMADSSVNYFLEFSAS